MIKTKIKNLGGCLMIITPFLVGSYLADDWTAVLVLGWSVGIALWLGTAVVLMSASDSDDKGGRG